MRPPRIQALVAACIAVTTAALTPLAPAAQPASDVADVRPEWVAVDADEALLRCGDRTRYYVVARLAKGTVLRLDGRSDEWARVVYPDAVTPFVRADDVAPDGDEHVRLTTASGLLAPDRSKGLDYSWRSVYQPALAPGTRLKIAEPVRNDQGQVVAYRVVPPAKPAARGYVQRSQLRPATPTEIAKAEQPAAGTSKPETKPETKPDTASTPAKPEAKPEATPADPKPEQTRPSTTPPAQPADSSDRPADTPIPTDGSGTDRPTGTDQPATTRPTPDAARPTTPARTDGVSEQVATLLQLETSFADARKLPREQLDTRLDEMIEEYTRVRSRLPDNAEGRVVRERVDERLAWLRLRAQTRDTRRELTRAIDEAAESGEAISRQLETLKTTGNFAFVGRMTVSTVYDGRRLPRKLRLVSIAPLDAGRTIGYVRQQDEEAARAFVGRVVGVRGRRTYDADSGLAVLVIDSVEAVNR